MQQDQNMGLWGHGTTTIAANQCTGTLMHIGHVGHGQYLIANCTYDVSKCDGTKSSPSLMKYLWFSSNALPSRKACKNRFMLAPVQCPHHVLYVFSYRNQLCEQAKGNLCFRNALLTHVHRWQRSSYTLFVSGIGLLLFSSKSEMHSDVLCRSLSLLHLDLKMQLMCVFWFLHCYHGLVASKACITLWKVKSKTHSSSRNRSTLTIFA